MHFCKFEMLIQQVLGWVIPQKNNGPNQNLHKRYAFLSYLTDIQSLMGSDCRLQTCLSWCTGCRINICHSTMRGCTLKAQCGQQLERLFRLPRMKDKTSCQSHHRLSSRCHRLTIYYTHTLLGQCLRMLSTLDLVLGLLPAVKLKVFHSMKGWQTGLLGTDLQSKAGGGQNICCVCTLGLIGKCQTWSWRRNARPRPPTANEKRETSPEDSVIAMPPERAGAAAPKNAWVICNAKLINYVRPVIAAAVNIVASQWRQLDTMGS